MSLDDDLIPWPAAEALERGEDPTRDLLDAATLAHVRSVVAVLDAIARCDEDDAA